MPKSTKLIGCFGRYNRVLRFVHPGVLLQVYAQAEVLCGAANFVDGPYFDAAADRLETRWATTGV